jgi:hypothetical protein
MSILVTERDGKPWSNKKPTSGRDLSASLLKYKEHVMQ